MLYDGVPLVLLPNIRAYSTLPYTSISIKNCRKLLEAPLTLLFAITTYGLLTEYELFSAALNTEPTEPFIYIELPSTTMWVGSASVPYKLPLTKLPIDIPLGIETLMELFLTNSFLRYKWKKSDGLLVMLVYVMLILLFSMIVVGKSLDINGAADPLYVTLT